MTNRKKGPNFAGSVRAVSLGKPDAIVVCCGAFDSARYVESFVTGKLKIASYDLVALPGGAFGFSAINSGESSEKLLNDSVGFFYSNHKPGRILLFGHVPCAQYLAVCQGNDDFANLRALIRGDMQNAALQIRKICGPAVTVEGYIAEFCSNAVEFERVDITPPLHEPCGRTHEQYGC